MSLYSSFRNENLINTEWIFSFVLYLWHPIRKSNNYSISLPKTNWTFTLLTKKESAAHKLQHTHVSEAFGRLHQMCEHLHVLIRLQRQQRRWPFFLSPNLIFPQCNSHLTCTWICIRYDCCLFFIISCELIRCLHFAKGLLNSVDTKQIKKLYFIWPFFSCTKQLKLCEFFVLNIFLICYNNLLPASYQS